MKIKLRPYQQEAVNAVYEHLRSRDDNPCIVLPTGCHAKGHPILMYDGSIKNVEDVVVGDMIMGDDSTPRTVLNLIRGHEPMAKIIPNKGEPFVVNVNHVLSLVSTCEGKANYKCYQRGGEITNVSVSEYIKKSKTWKHLRKLYHTPVNFKSGNELIIPPYILGLLIGDGSFYNGCNFTTMDGELADEFIRYADTLKCHIRVSNNGGKASTYHCVNKSGEKNPLVEKLKTLGLYGHNAYEKFIPQEYKTSSKANRFEILAGILDTDGYCPGENCSYITASTQLADDIAYLARSLGFCVTSRIKTCHCQNNFTGDYILLNISGDFSTIPFRRIKHDMTIRKQKKNVLRTGFSVELLPEDDYYGFTIDGNHLYVDGNFFVHHNCGKSLVLAKIASDAVSQWGGRVLILAHVKELLEQNAEKVKFLCPEIDLGIYSAGLRSRDTKNSVIVAGIQSVYKRACELDAFDLIVVDEAHLIPPDGEGRYREFLKDAKIVNPNVRIIGLTATPYRLKGGLICKPENFLNHVCYEAGLKEMINQGYLSPLVPKAGDMAVDFDSLHIKGGEFVSEEVEILMNNDKLVQIACKEIVEYTRDRKTVLIFGVSIDHCKKIKKHIESFSGEECAIVTGDTPANERAMLLDRIKGKETKDLFGNAINKPLKYLVNVSVLTTGFDAPNIDAIAILRPTASPGLLVQMCGRGLRLSPETGKTNCLIMDYGENILRHGPLDAINVIEKQGGRGKGEKPAKKCPKCKELIETARTICPTCGYVFPPKELKHTDVASADGLLTGQVTTHDYTVDRVIYQRWTKRGASVDTPSTLCIEYCIGFGEYFREWICPEHTGYARQKFEKWWAEHRINDNVPTPDSIDEAIHLAHTGQLKSPAKITIRHVAGEKFDRISHYEYGEDDNTVIPAMQTDDDIMALLGDDVGCNEISAGNVYIPSPDDEVPF